MTLDVIDRNMVRVALELLDDVQALGACDLARLDIVAVSQARSGYRDTPLGKGTALKTILRELIEGMKPVDRSIDASIPAIGVQERYHLILSKQYLEHVDPSVIIDMLVLSSEGYFYQLRKRAFDFVASRLGEMEQQHLLEENQRLAARQAALPASELAPPRPPQLPETELFVGRESELEVHRRQVESEGFTVIGGFPGIGKTALAAELARQLAPSGKILWHACRPGDNADSLIWAVAQFLAFHGRDGLWRTLQHAAEKYREPLSLGLRIDYVREHLLNKGYVVCLDDLHVIADDAEAMELVRRLVDAARLKQVRVVLTTRRTPDFLSTERLRPLSGLRLDEVRLLAERKHVILSDFECRSLQDYTRGNPDLLLYLLDLLQRSADPSAFLDHLPETAGIEQFISREVDGWLNEQARSIVVAMAVLGGGPASATAIGGVAGVSGAASLLAALANRDLVVIELGGYRLRRLLQTFYLGYPTSQERDLLHLRAAEFYTQNETERDWLRSAIHYVDAGRPDVAARILAEHGEDSLSRGRVEHAIRLLVRLEGALLAPPLKVDLLILRAEARLCRGEVAVAQEDYEHALWRLGAEDSADSRQQRARVLRGLAYLLRHSNPHLALNYIRRGLEEIAGTESLEHAALLIRQGHIQNQVGAHVEAILNLEQGLQLLAPSPSQLRGLALLNLGNAYGFRGDRPRAVALYQQALAVFAAVDDDRRTIDVHLGLGIEADLGGEWPKAIAHYEKALKMARNWGGVKEEAACELALGNLRSKQGQLPKAEQHYARCLALGRQHVLNDHVVDALLGMAALHLRRSSPGAAAACLQEAEEISMAIGSKGHWPELERTWALYYVATQQMDQSSEHAARSVEIARDLDIPPELGLSLRVLGQTFQLRQQHGEALDCLGESYALLAGWNPYEAALTQMVWSRSLRALGRQEEERSLQAGARRILQSLKLPFRDNASVI